MSKVAYRVERSDQAVSARESISVAVVAPPLIAKSREVRRLNASIGYRTSLEMLCTAGILGVWREKSSGNGFPQKLSKYSCTPSRMYVEDNFSLVNSLFESQYGGRHYVLAASQCTLEIVLGFRRARCGDHAVAPVQR